jgi:hypothetical protein
VYVLAKLGLAVTDTVLVELRLLPVQLYVYGLVPPLTLSVKFTVPPLPAHHSVLPLAVMLDVSVFGATVTITWSVAEQPLLSVTVTLYVWLAVMFTTFGFAVVVDDKPADGDHEYVYGLMPPLAVGLPPMPMPVVLHTGKVLSNPASATGVGFTVTVVLAVAVHPLLSVTVTV